MKLTILICLLLKVSISFGQNPDSCYYGKQTIIGKVILVDLKNPVTEKPIKNAMVLKLSKPITFIPRGEDFDESKAKVNMIRIYGCLNCNEKPEIKYKNLINKTVKITADFSYALSGHYPLDVNIVDKFEFKILQ